MSSKKPASSAEASAEGRQLASRLYGAGNARLSAQSPIIPHSTFGASSASGSGSLVSHYEPSLIPKARGLAGSKSSAGLLNSTKRSTQQHPLAGLNQSASQTQLGASRGRPEVCRTVCAVVQNSRRFSLARCCNRSAWRRIAWPEHHLVFFQHLNARDQTVQP